MTVDVGDLFGRSRKFEIYFCQLNWLQWVFVIIGCEKLDSLDKKIISILKKIIIYKSK